MANYRVEAALDPESGLFSAELFYPSDSAKAVGKTKPVYSTREEALRRVEESFLALFPAGDTLEQVIAKIHEAATVAAA